MSREEAIGRPYWTVYPPLDGPLPGCRSGTACGRPDANGASPTCFECEEEVRLNDGTVLSSRSFVVRNNDGSYRHSAHILQDITQRRRSEESRLEMATALAEREAQLQQLLRSMTEGVLVVDPTGRVVYANPASARLFARNSAELHNQAIGLPIGGPDAQEIQLVTPEGGIRTAEMRVRDLHWRGEAAHLVNLRDITERKQIETELRRSAIVFDESRDGILITDAEKRIIRVNRAFTEITGYSQDELEGQDPRILASGEHNQDFFRTMWASIKKHGMWVGELFNRRRDGSQVVCLTTIREVRNEADRVTNYLSLFSDLSRIKEYQRQLELLMHIDPLTGLPNRMLFHDRLEQAVAAVQRKPGVLALLSIDIKDFKTINFSLGNLAGDDLLQQLGERTVSLLGAENTVARLGGDEFGVLLVGASDIDAVVTTTEALCAALHRPFFLDGQEVHITTAIGLSVHNSAQQTHHSQLFQQANSALEDAKREGVDYRFFSKELGAQARERIELGTELRHALQRDELTVHYQPQVDLATGRWIGVEALVRWPHPSRGWIPPGHFIPIAEQIGVVVEIGDWVTQRACTDARAWLNAGLNVGRLCVNFAAPELRSPRLFDKIAAALDRADLPPSCFELEITESLIVDPDEEIIERLEQLRDFGIRVAIDDFGTGYSALSYLKDLPIDRLKIDRSFVQGLPDDTRVAAINRAVIELGSNLGFEVIAEGIETEEQRLCLLNLGCTQGQGYLFSRPHPPQELKALEATVRD